MATPSETRAKVTSTYTAAADCFDASTNTFWHRFGRSTVENLNLKPGARVLDVCCGTGASAIPAAETVGVAGSVLGVDLTDALLQLARAKARQRNIENVEFRVGDMLDLQLPGGQFDAVVCVFGIFFVPDMPSAIGELWRMVSADGVLAVTTWGDNIFEPLNSVFWKSVEDIRPDLKLESKAWERIATPRGLEEMLAEGGVKDVAVIAERAQHPIASPEDWWTAVMGSGYRGTIERLSESEREWVRKVNLAYIRDFGIDAVEVNVLYAIARKS